MCTIIDQEGKKKDNICVLFALYAAMSEKQKFIVTVSEHLDFEWHEICDINDGDHMNLDERIQEICRYCSGGEGVR